ncbi:MAG TPA: phospholipase, partial [Verrucomicrobiae bacterium]|nr:phospholipase [Verrucomicrobiae bacterium]
MTAPLLVQGETCRGIYEATETGLLVDAGSYYRAFHDAAERARSFILIAGWQFDSGVDLLRGGNPGTRGDTALLPFLSRLCETNPYLHVYILAWDFSMLFAQEREWFQDFIFNWNGHDRILFRFDDTHAVGGSHHQKYVVIDGAIGFVGGVDLCSARWDDRRHLTKNPLRTGTDGKEYDPYHDVQTYHTGPAARDLEELFLDRWVKSGGEALDLLHPPER